MVATNSNPTFEAVTHGHGHDVESSRPLLGGEEGDIESSQENRLHEEERVGELKRSWLFLGLAVGLCMQFSALGLNYLFLCLWEDRHPSRSFPVPAVLSLSCSLFACAAALVILEFVRRGAVASSSSSYYDGEVQFLIRYRLVVGAIGGFGSGRIAAELWLGTTAHALCSFLTLASAIAVCQITLRRHYYSSSYPYSDGESGAGKRSTTRSTTDFSDPPKVERIFLRPISQHPPRIILS